MELIGTAASGQSQAGGGGGGGEGRGEEEEAVGRNIPRDKSDSRCKLFNIIYTNARSVCNKMNELRCVVSELKPDFILVNESWSNSSHSDSHFKIDGYSLVCRSDRSDTVEGVGGGLLLWSSVSLSISEINSPVFTNFNQCCSVDIPVWRFLYLASTDISASQPV